MPIISNLLKNVPEGKSHYPLLQPRLISRNFMTFQPPALRPHIQLANDIELKLLQNLSFLAGTSVP